MTVYEIQFIYINVNGWLFSFAEGIFWPCQCTHLHSCIRCFLVILSVEITSYGRSINIFRIIFWLNVEIAINLFQKSIYRSYLRPPQFGNFSLWILSGTYTSLLHLQFGWKLKQKMIFNTNLYTVKSIRKYEICNECSRTFKQFSLPTALTMWLLPAKITPNKLIWKRKWCASSHHAQCSLIDAQSGRLFLLFNFQCEWKLDWNEWDQLIDMLSS